MTNIVELYKDLIVQIATPYNMGTGFYLPGYNIIVTNEHVVRDNSDVVIIGSKFKKQIVKVIFLDMKYDLAFLKPPIFEEDVSLPSAVLSDDGSRTEDAVIAIGQPFGLEYSAIRGIISNPSQREHGIDYIYHDAALSPGNSGGPLVNKKGDIIGVNTFVLDKDNNVGFSLPVSYLKSTLKEFRKVSDSLTATRCYTCLNIIFEQKTSSKYCPECGNEIVLPSSLQPFEPVGCAYTIEQMLKTLGYDPKLTRRGPNNWGIRQGSALISISYYEKTGLIIGDASLCNLPPSNIQPLYEYLLRQNHKIEGLTLSIKGQDIVLSLLIYDRYLNVETGKKLFQHLFERADYYDNVLVEKYGATWKSKKQTV